MRRNACLFLLPLALGLCCAAWGADESANVAGNWQLNWQGRQGAQQGTLTLQQDGTKLTGTMQAERGSVPLKGTIKGSAISFNVEMQGERRSITLAFVGTVEGDKMNGTIESKGGHGGRHGSGGEDHTWSATREQGSSANQSGSSN